jgi:hypothetical protein
MFPSYTFLIAGTSRCRQRQNAGDCGFGQRKEEKSMENRFLWSNTLLEPDDAHCRCSETKVWHPLPAKRDSTNAPPPAKTNSWNEARPLASNEGRANASPPWIARIAHAVNRRFLWLLLAAYAAAAIWPQAGLWIRSVSFGELSLLDSAYPDWNYLVWVMALVVLLCLLMFVAGWGLARLLKADEAQKYALMYGLGMNNNGTGLVLASHSEVLLPLILYNLVQHLAAGGVKSVLRRSAAPTPSRRAS